MMFRKIFFLGAAIGITIIAVFIQQILDKDSAYKTKIEIDNVTYSLSLPLINQGVIDYIIELEIPDTSIHGFVYYKYYNSQEKWKKNGLIRLNDKLVSILPYQKPNVKLMYYIELTNYKNTYTIAQNNPIVVRYEGEVPKYIQYSGVVLFFLALIIICYLGLAAAFNISELLKYIPWTFYLLLVGIIFEFIRFYFAYQHLFLQPIPFNNFTFYKYLIIFFIWWFLYLWRKKKLNRWIVFVTTLLSIFLYCIPYQALFKFLY